VNKLSVILVLPLCALMACGGGGGGSGVNTSGGSSGCTGAAPVGAPNVVTVTAGQTASGTNIAVACAASSPTPNAENLGVGATVNGTEASNTGAQIAQGTTMSVILFGPALSAGMNITISGPNDITVSNPTSIRSTGNVPGLAFTAVVSPTAALGARTVILKDANNDITTFTGGLEVIP
jgi:hypothetical protein